MAPQDVYVGIVRALLFRLASERLDGVVEEVTDGRTASGVDKEDPPATGSGSLKLRYDGLKGGG